MRSFLCLIILSSSSLTACIVASGEPSPEPDPVAEPTTTSSAPSTPRVEVKRNNCNPSSTCCCYPKKGGGYDCYGSGC